MSAVFRHGRLRLYLLKLLDEAPRHGYDLIRLLQDRFLGLYTPSPGVIYPTLAQFEEQGLLTHDEVDGKKIYRITGLGRSQLHARRDELAELEDEITAYVRGIARQVSEDVRQTVRNLREELVSTRRDTRGKTRRQADNPAQKGRGAGASLDRQEGPRREELGISRRKREHHARDSSTPPVHDSQHGYADLEQLTTQFAREVQMALRHAQAVSEDALEDLQDILVEALERIKTEVFSSKTPRSVSRENFL